MKKIDGYSTQEYPKTLLIAVDAPYNKVANIQTYFDEFLHLVASNEIPYEEMIEIKLRSIDKGFFFTKGKLEEIHALCQEKEYEEIIISDQLTPLQERNLNELLQCKIFDRTQLILEIFEKSAHSAEGKMQVAIAMFKHQKSRVGGKGFHMSQQSGHIGNKGPGETAKERELRHLEEQVNRLKKKLTGIEKNRETRSKQRLVNNIFQVCLIGYTNTGKSTILNRLTKAHVLAEDRLFATLDTTTRELFIDGQKKGVISDTVGFIQQLPHLLIEAFKSTLNELKHADLLLHVIDISDADWQNHTRVVHEILGELHVAKPMLYVFNKIDAIDNLEEIKKLCDKYQPQVFISAQDEAGIEPLIDYLRTIKTQQHTALKDHSQADLLEEEPEDLS